MLAQIRTTAAVWHSKSDPILDALTRALIHIGCEVLPKTFEDHSHLLTHTGRASLFKAYDNCGAVAQIVEIGGRYFAAREVTRAESIDELMSKPDLLGTSATWGAR